jgi:hypothetical protein
MRTRQVASNRPAGTYAAIYLSRHDRDAVSEFLTYGWGIAPDKIVRQLHLTIYAAQPRLPGIFDTREDILIECDVSESPSGDFMRDYIAF